MNLRQFQHFLLVAEERSFRRAAERAHITQPALSNSIKSLENRLGVQLLERTRHAVSLSAVGETLLPHARKILADTQNFDDMVRYLKIGDAADLRIGLVPTYAYSFGGEAISRWMAKRPKSRIEVVYQTTQHLALMLEREEIDFFICDTRQVRSNPEVEVTPIGEFTGGLFCRTGHPVLERKPASRKDLLTYGFACVRVPHAMRDELAAAFSVDGSREPFLALECDAVTVLRTAVLGTDLIWLANRFNVQQDVDAGHLVEVPSDFEFRIQWGIARRRDRVLPPAAVPLMDILAELPRGAL